MITIVCAQSHPEFLRPHRLSQAVCPRNFLSKKNGVGAIFSFLPFLPDPGIEAVSPALAGRFFTTEPPGSPLTPLKNFHCVYSGLRNIQVTNHKN